MVCLWRAVYEATGGQSSSVRATGRPCTAGHSCHRKNIKRVRETVWAAMFM